MKVKISMEATQTCCQMYIIIIAFSPRLQESYVPGFGMLPFGLAGKQELRLAKMSEVSAFGFTAHYNKPRPFHQTVGKKAVGKMKQKIQPLLLKSLTRTVTGQVALVLEEILCLVLARYFSHSLSTAFSKTTLNTWFSTCLQ